jgi:ribosomal protein S28E/S33
LLGGAVAAVLVGGRAAAETDAQETPERRCREFVLSGGPVATEPIEVDDNLFVYVNRDLVFGDRAARAGAVAPIAFRAKRGDKLRIVARDVVAPCRQLDPLYLHCASGGAPRRLFRGFAQDCDNENAAGAFVTKTYKI